jgi:hypothetical protein
MSRFNPGDFVACYLTNSKVIDGLLQWGIVLKVSETLEDIYVLDSLGNSEWYPCHRWTDLRLEGVEKTIDIDAILA